MLSQKNQAADTWTLLQVSQNFRASEKYSYDSYQQLRLILDTLEISVTLRLSSGAIAPPLNRWLAGIRHIS
jgi:hypothetical protein